MPDADAINQEFEKDKITSLMQRVESVLNSIDKGIEGFKTQAAPLVAIASDTSKLLSIFSKSMPELKSIVEAESKSTKDLIKEQSSIAADNEKKSLALKLRHRKEDADLAMKLSAERSRELLYFHEESINESKRQFNERLTAEAKNRKVDMKLQREIRHDNAVQAKISERAAANEKEKMMDLAEERALRHEAMFAAINESIMANKPIPQKATASQRGTGSDGGGYGLLDFVLDFGKKIKKGLKAMWGFATGLAGKTWRGIKSVASKAWKGISGVASKVWGGIKATGTKMWSGLRAVGGKAMSVLRGGATAVAAAGGKVLATAKAGAVAVATAGKTALSAVGKIGARAVGMLGPAAAVAGAAVAGWQLGSWLDKKFGVSDKIADFLTRKTKAEKELEEFDQKSFSKQRKANVEKQKNIAAVKKETGLSDEEINKLTSGQDNERFAKLTTDQQKSLVAAKKAKMAETKELIKRLAAEERQKRADVGIYTSEKEQAEIDRLVKLQQKAMRGLKKQGEQFKQIKKIAEEKPETIMPKEKPEAVMPKEKSQIVSKEELIKRLKQEKPETATSKGKPEAVMPKEKPETVAPQEKEVVKKTEKIIERTERAMEKTTIDRLEPVLKAKTIVKKPEPLVADKDDKKDKEEEKIARENNEKHNLESIDKLSSIDEKFNVLIDAVRNIPGKTVTRDITPLKNYRNTV